MKEDETLTLPDGRTLGYAEYGDPAGKPVFFFHGWPSSRYQGAYLDPLAADRGLRVVVPDRPGVGLSSPLPGRRFTDWPPDVAALADHLGFGRFSLFGVSGGCPYTLATCAALAERIPRAAIACGAPPLAEGGDRSHMHWAYRTLSGMKSLRRAALPVILPVSRWMVGRGADHAPMSWMLRSIPARDREALHVSGGWETITRSYLEAIRNGPAAVLAEGELYLKPWNFDPAEIHDVSIRFWHGLADANLPCETAQRLAARISCADGRWIDGEGHYSLPIHHSGEMLDWLAAG